MIFETMSDIIVKIYGEVNEVALRRALSASDVDEVSEYEAKTGKAIVAADNYFNPNFVRSGKIDEYKEVFSESEIHLICEMLVENRVALRGDPRE